MNRKRTMKVKSKKEMEYAPIKVVITLESQEEFEAFFQALTIEPITDKEILKPLIQELKKY